MNSKVSGSGWSESDQRTKRCRVMCYDFEGDLPLLEYLMGQTQRKTREIENFFSQLVADRVADVPESGREHHALYDARANAYAFVRGLP